MLHEPVDARVLAGAALIVGGVALVNGGVGRRVVFARERRPSEPLAPLAAGDE